MREAVIVSVARTPIGKAYRGAFNDTQGQALAAHAISHAIQRAKVEPGQIEDVIVGCALQQGSTGGNVAVSDAVFQAVARPARLACIVTSPRGADSRT